MNKLDEPTAGRAFAVALATMPADRLILIVGHFDADLGFPDQQVSA